MTEHTPGPWTAKYHEPGNDVQSGLAGFSIQAFAEGIAYNIPRPGNADLIAAAPDLLAALEVATDHIADLHSEVTERGNPLAVEEQEILNQARAAIARAKMEDRAS